MASSFLKSLARRVAVIGTGALVLTATAACVAVVLGRGQWIAQADVPSVLPLQETRRLAEQAVAGHRQGSDTAPRSPREAVHPVKESWRWLHGLQTSWRRVLPVDRGPVRLRLEDGPTQGTVRILMEGRYPGDLQELIGTVSERVQRGNASQQDGRSQWRPQTYLAVFRRIIDSEAKDGFSEDPYANALARFQDDLAQYRGMVDRSQSWWSGLVDDRSADYRASTGGVPAAASTESLIRSLHRVLHDSALFAGDAPGLPARASYVTYLLVNGETSSLVGVADRKEVRIAPVTPVASVGAVPDVLQGDREALAGCVAVALFGTWLLWRGRRNPLISSKADLEQIVADLRSSPQGKRQRKAAMPSVMDRVFTDSSADTWKSPTRPAANSSQVICVYGTSEAATRLVVDRIARSLSQSGGSVVSLVHDAESDFGRARSLPVWGDLVDGSLRIESLLGGSGEANWWRFETGSGGCAPEFWGFPDGDPTVRRCVELMQSRFAWVVVPVYPVVPGLALPGVPWAHRRVVAVEPDSVRRSDLEKWLGRQSESNLALVYADPLEAEGWGSDFPKWLSAVTPHPAQTPVASGGPGVSILAILDGSATVNGGKT